MDFDAMRAKLESEMKAAADMMDQGHANGSSSTKDAAPLESESTKTPEQKKKDDDVKSDTKKAILGAAKTHMTGAQHSVRDMNKTYALVNMGKDSLVAVNRGDTYDFWSIKNFLVNTGNETVPVTTSRGTKDVGKGENWLKSPDRRTYARADFAPSGDVPDDVFNLWRGFGVKPIPGISFKTAARGCSLFLRHIRENLCKGSLEEYHYFMRWCADMIQRPHIKSGVAVSISGRKGTGKTKVAEALSGLLGGHSTTISQSRHLVGNFNYHLRQAILVVAEEAIWGGDKHADGVLKHMITSTDFAAEQKGVDVVSIKSLARIMFIGNKTWMFPADEDERRLFALTCGDKRRVDTEYFRAIDLQLYGSSDGMQGNPAWREHEGIRSFMTFLSMIDLNGFHIRHIPETEGLRDQRQSSLEPHARYFQELLESRTIGFESDNQIDYLKRPMEWLFMEAMVIPKSDLYENGYLVWHRKHNIKAQPIAQNAFWRWVKRVFEWSTCKVGGKGFQVPAVKAEGLKYSAARFSLSMKVDPIELDDTDY